MTARGDFERLPLIDVSGLESADLTARRETARRLDRAARNAGFFYVTEHGLPQALSDGLVAAAAEFFALPEGRKQRYYIGDSTNHRGYVPAGEEVFYAGSKDSKEAFDLSLDLPESDPDYRAGNRFLGPNRWPSEVRNFRERVYGYYGAVTALGRRLLRGFLLALDLPEDHFDRALHKPPSQLRLIHYPHVTDALDAPGIGAHTDYECFTILHATSPGLEVLNARNRWVDAPPVPGAFVINIGDLLEVLSNGRWVSTAHRVRKVSEERYSMPLFFNLDYDAEIAPASHLVQEDGEARYPSVRAGEHLLAQTAQSFSYMKRQIARGEMQLPTGALGLASFARERAERAHPAAHGIGGTVPE
ncbi:MAG TPA: 2-oxoglutarate and iron-dependent oxygenase domain-containing protein [Polyangiaceae bacterium]|nr:2-oxoglutarate and iron-dependent oxygenase domain-containing protein [Polyangiaceae bacterium]HYQ30701.1 2-oxoglutarate and iron-dependent oxygenase domain-containing protein [Polyangiaceae bacterium]